MKSLTVTELNHASPVCETTSPVCETLSSMGTIRIALLYPVYDEEEAMDIIQAVDNFSSSFYDSLSVIENVREFTDCIDRIENLIED